MAITNYYINPVDGTRSETEVNNPVLVYTSYLSGSDVIPSDEMNSYKSSKLVNPMGNKISLSPTDGERQTSPDPIFPLFDNRNQYGFNSTTLMTASPADELSFLNYTIAMKERDGVRAVKNVDFKRCLLSGGISYDEVDGKKRYSVNETFSLKYAYGEKTSFLDTNGIINDIIPTILFTKSDGYYGIELRSMRPNCSYTELGFSKQSNLGNNNVDFGYDSFIPASERRAIWKAYERGFYPYDSVTEYQTVDNLTYSIYHGGSSGNYSEVTSYLNNEHDALLLIAGAGLAFEVDGVIYKPIVEGGVVVDFTSDMSVQSEWDDWTDYDSRKLPDTPDGGGTPDDGISDMELGFTGYENGFVNYYICTSGNIATLVGEMSSQTDFPNLIGNIVSLKSYACTLNGMYTGDIVPIKVGQYHASATGIKIATTTYSKQIASFNIKGAHGNINKPHFLDFAPYTRLEVYIPFCGTVPLPPECMYNTVTVHIVTDITSGSCTGVVKCRGNIVAQKSGIIGTTIPLSINDSASQNNAFNQGMMNTANAGGKVVAGGAVGSVNAGGILSALGSAFNTTQTMNDNYTRVIGTQGDKSAYAMPKKCYLKRYRTIDLSDDNYTQSIGRPVCKRRALASGDGFTVCDNPQVYGAMTLAEKNEIEQFMRNGIIL